MTTKEPITHDGPDRSYKLCECSVCGKQEQCTPSRDFYNRTPLGPLECEDCFWSNLSAQGMTRLDTL